ncbi:MAG TPA: BlaI/MecI/CopY family transcriptional regulator [Thermoanaerobaculia bacterium]|nr:BlaI/MecI/CopY family transcriptional regulator [Thermoanaerobaculia bacterium]
MARPPQISDAEWDVMQVLWETSPLSGSEVADRLGGHPKTVKTLLGRLVRKGVLRFREENNRYLYRPAVPRERYVEEESRSFLERVFGGEATPALVHFVESVELSEEEIRELRELLERRAKGEKR